MARAASMSRAFGRQFALDEQQYLIAGLVRFRLVTRCLTRREFHYRSLTSRCSLQDFEPLFCSIDVGASCGHDTRR